MDSMICSTSCDKAKSVPRAKICVVYGIFITAAIVVYKLIANGEFSSILTLAAMFQCLAFCLLGVQVYSSGVQGISARSLKLDALSFACRLSSTLWLNGYLPEDETGDHVYQILDIMSLILVLGLLRVVSTNASYDAEGDQLSERPFILGALVFAYMFHGDLNDRPLFDILWMWGLNISAISVLPQLWLMTHMEKPTVPVLISHFVGVMAFSRAISGSYMWYAAEEITCDPWFASWGWEFQHTGYAILAAHAVHLILLGDFGYYYVKTMAKSGITADLELPGAMWQV